MSRGLVMSQKVTLPLFSNESTPSLPPSFVARLRPPGPATVISRLTMIERAESRVRRLVLIQLSGAVTSMTVAPAPVTTWTSEAASMLARSMAFNHAFRVVGAHTPAEQDMFLVGLEEIDRKSVV